MPSPLNGLIDAGGVADDEPGRARPWARPSRPSAAGRSVGRAAADSGEIPQYVGRGGRELVHEVGGVDGLEVAERRQQADADVDRAVADREDPAVAGQRVAVAVASRRGRDSIHGVVVQRALAVAADGHALRPRRGCGTCPAPGRSGSWRRRRSRRSGPGSPRCGPSSLSSTIAPRTKPAVDDGRDRLGALRAASAPAFTACSATISSRSRRRTT